MRLLVAAAAAALIVPAPALGWTWPVAGPVLIGFSFDPAHPYAAGQHRGIDVGADAGSPVVAPTSGVVSFAGTVPTSGKAITIETPGGLAVTLTHLGSIGVAKDAVIAEGAAGGSAGRRAGGRCSAQACAGRCERPRDARARAGCPGPDVAARDPGRCRAWPARRALGGGRDAPQDPGPRAPRAPRSVRRRRR